MFWLRLLPDDEAPLAADGGDAFSGEVELVCFYSFPGT